MVFEALQLEQQCRAIIYWRFHIQRGFLLLCQKLPLCLQQKNPLLLTLLGDGDVGSPADGFSKAAAQTQQAYQQDLTPQYNSGIGQQPMQNYFQQQHQGRPSQMPPPPSYPSPVPLKAPPGQQQYQTSVRACGAVHADVFSFAYFVLSCVPMWFPRKNTALNSACSTLPFQGLYIAKSIYARAF